MKREGRNGNQRKSSGLWNLGGIAGSGGLKLYIVDGDLVPFPSQHEGLCNAVKGNGYFFEGAVSCTQAG